MQRDYGVMYKRQIKMTIMFTYLSSTVVAVAIEVVVVVTHHGEQHFYVKLFLVTINLNWSWDLP